ncbi:MAG TPA: SUMF1/EgtB/PvdO family nonheme iron enzyme [Bacteroidales bacterium]|nr:SUMF1/EgtB/PvdO family nonheme iron enzyme [Bacteroidales bacterium]
MRKSLVIVSIFTLFLTACGGYYGSGDLVGVQRKNWYTPDPHGMLFIPPGSYQMGPSDQDVPNAMTAQTKTVTLQGFWMDETEITNSEYRQFVYWVRDSLAMTVIAADNSNTSLATYTADQFFVDYSNSKDPAVADFFDESLQGYEYDMDGFRFLNWNAPLDYGDLELKNMMMTGDIPLHVPLPKDQKVAAEGYKLPSKLYIAPPAAAYHYFRQVDLNTDALYYEYFWTDLKQAAQKHTYKKNKEVDQDVARTFDRKADHGLRVGHHFNPETGQYEGHIKDREKLDKDQPWEDFADRKIGEKMPKYSGRYDFLMHEKIHIYPDTLCWMSDYTYSYNEPMTKMYFWHPAYDYYPVVGVNWKQATAFSIWRSHIKNAYQRETNDFYLNEYRLPTESEWEYAARGGLDLSMYPWGGLYTRNFTGCFIANFKPNRGNYYDDGGTQTLIVATYDPNEWGLYDMAGNVAEWTNNAWDESAYSYTHDLNPDYEYYAHPDDPPAMKKKVIRGGSWKDVSYYMQNGTRSFEFQDSAKSYIGFRNVRTYLGRHREDGASSSQVY